MDRQVRYLERVYASEPTLAALQALFMAYEKRGIEEDIYPHLVELLQDVRPFTQNDWPWARRNTFWVCRTCFDKTNQREYTAYEDCFLCGEQVSTQRIEYTDYRPALHRDILNLIVRIKPLSMVFEILARGASTDLADLLRVIRRQLVHSQTHLITMEEFADEESYYNVVGDPEYVEEFMMGRGMYQYPEFLVLEPAEGAYLDCVVITVVHTSSPENRAANRYNVCLSGEPSTGIFWEHSWDSERSYWYGWGDYGNYSQRDRASSTFLPYKEYCYLHKMDVEDCPSCPACGDVDPYGRKTHPCECAQCEDCGLYWNDWQWEVVPEKMRCQCEISY